MATITATADSFTTGFSTTGLTFYTSSSSTGNNFNYAVGHTAENPGSTASGSGSWTYVKASGGSTSGTGYADYSFDFSSIPNPSTINSITIRCYGAVESSSQSTSHADITLYSGSTQKGTMQKFTSSTNSIITISSPGTWTRDELQSAKLRFAVGYYGGHIFGITWIVDYTYSGVTYTVTATSNVASITASPASETVYPGETVVVTLDGESISGLSITDNNSDITSQLVQHQHDSGGTLENVLGSYSLTSGGFNGSGASYFQGLVGKGVDNTKTTSNYYSSGSGTIAVFTYDLHFTNIPSNATITRVYCEVNGHAESTSNSNEYMCVQLISGSTNISSELNFKSIGTSNTTQTLEATTIPTVSQLASLQLKCRLGYYGGAINGATCYVVYTVPVSGYYWTYTISNIAGNHAVVVSQGSTDTIYFKNGSSWAAAIQVYKKVSGSWVLQSDLSNVFDSTKNYVKG